MATIKHWLQAMTEGRTHRRNSGEIHNHDETAELWSTMSSPRYPNSFKLPAKLIHTEPSQTTRAYDVQRMHSYQDFIYNPDCEQMITAILSVVINRPHLPLPPEYNSILLHVLESYNSLVKSLEKEKYNTEIDALAMEQTLRDWEKDRKEFRAEIKRLEERIAQLQGVEAMLKARENSILRKKNYETSDGAIARIRRKGNFKEKSSSTHKLLHQPSIIDRSRINLSPPRLHNSTELHVGHPPTARSQTALSALMESQQIAPDSDVPTDEDWPVRSSGGALARSAYIIPSSHDANKMEESPFSMSQSSSGESSIVTAINLKLQQKPAKTTSRGSASSLYGHLGRMRLADASSVGNALPKSCGTQFERHSRRQFSYLPGDDSEARLKGFTALTRQNDQNRSGTLGRSLAYDAEQSLLAVSPTHVYAKTQERPGRRSGTSSNYSVTADGKMEIFGPPDQMNGPKVSAIESLERVRASIHATGGTGRVRALNNITAAVFTVTQKETTARDDDRPSQSAVKSIQPLF